MTIKKISIAAAIMASSVAVAEENSRLEELVVTSSRVETPLRQLGTSVSVLTAEQIQASGFHSLADVLRTTPSIAVSRNGGPGKVTSLRIRGEEGFRTLVLIDGIEVSDPTGTQVMPQMQHILSSNIARVEVLRGAQGMMYGADAGGVINISTRDTDEPLTAELAYESGRYDTEQLNAMLGGQLGSIDYFISASDYSSAGFNARTSDILLQDDDPYDNQTLHGRLGWQISEQLRVSLVAHDIDAESEFDGCSIPPFFLPTHDCRGDYMQSDHKATVDYQSEVFNHQLAVGSTEVERQNLAAGIESFSTDGTIDSVSYLGSAALSDAVRFVYGVDQSEEEIMSTGGRSMSRERLGIYLEYQGSVADRFYYTAGLRQDDIDGFDNYNSYRASAAYVFDLAGGNNIKLKASYGTGFRVPSLSEAAYNSSPFAYAPAAGVVLDLEESSGFDVGVEYYADNGLHLEMVYFDQKVENEIFFDLDTFSGYLQADGETTSSGVELIAEIPLNEQWLLSMNRTYNDTETVAGVQRSRRPKHLTNITLSYHSENWLFSGSLRGDQDAIDANSGMPLPNYTVVDGSVTYILNDNLRITGRVENAFDEEYEEVPGFNTAGVSGYMGLKLSY